MQEKVHRISGSDNVFKGQASRQELVLVWAFVVAMFVACGAIAYITGGIK